MKKKKKMKEQHANTPKEMSGEEFATKKQSNTDTDIQSEEQDLSAAQSENQDGLNKQITDTDRSEEIASLELRLNEANDKFLRLFSEFDNFRKRTAKERLELSKTATADIITALLPVLDDLERACMLEETGDNQTNSIEGFRLILNKFKAILRQKGVEEIKAVGHAFDTDFHEAISHVPANEETQKGTVVEEILKGYLLNGKIIRHARVVVAN